MNVSITNLPVKTSDVEEVLRLAEFVSAIGAGLAKRYSQNGQVTVRIWFKHATSEARQRLAEAGWTMEFDDGFWVASQLAQEVEDA